MAGSARWDDLTFELKTNAHPPLFFLLLRGIVRHGYFWLYRAISIGAGVGSIVVVGLVARKLLAWPALQLWCAFAFAVSTDAIAISAEIRSYQLAVFLVLLAFLSWLDMFPNSGEPIRIGPYIQFALWSSLAVLTHYSAAFFLVACVVVPLLLRRFTGKSLLPATAALGFPCAVFAVEYVVHAGAQPMQGYLVDFYRTGTAHERLFSFISRNIVNFFNLFSPVQLHNAFVVLLLVVGFAALAVQVIRSRFATRATLRLAALIVLEILAASLVNKYPFGGMLRHQYIAGPFLLIAAFVVLDALVKRASPVLRTSLAAALLIGCTANLIVEGPKVIFYPGVVLLRNEFAVWRAAFPNARAIYLDHWAVIGYFIHTNDQPRTFVQRVADDAVIDEYRLPNGTEIFYDKTRILLNFSEPSLYKSLAASLRASGVKELAVFFYSAGDVPIDQSPAELEALIIRKAADQGLSTSKVVVGRTSLAAGFSLKEPTSITPTSPATPTSTGVRHNFH